MNHLEKFDAWAKHPAIDAQTRAELATIAGNEAEIRARFGEDIAFGTAGLRGILGAGTARINRYTVRRATLGFARYLKENGTAARGVVIAHDNRRMSRELCMETAGVLAAEGVRSFIFDGLRTTPELSFAVRHLGAAGGVVITASHNPPEYNGYKLYDAEGCQLVPHLTERVAAFIEEITDPLSVPCLAPAEAGNLITVLDASVDEAYLTAVMDIRLRPDVKKDGLTVVYSPQHGTGNVPVREVLARCGYHVVPVEEQCFPDQDFINTKSPNPENPEAFSAALALARRVGADIAITTDPDCDRLGVAVRDGSDYRLLSGNQSGAVLLEYILSTRAQNGTLPTDARMCNTIVTSTLGDSICQSYGVTVEKTLTGFKFIGEKIHGYEQSGHGTYVFGYEESYGCLISPIARDKDAVQASLMLCEAAAYYKTQGKTLADVLEDIYRKHGYFRDALTNVVKTEPDGAAEIAAMLEGLRRDPPRAVGDVAVCAVEDYLSPEMQAKGFPASNVLRYLLADGSWVAVRPSGTEPKCKYYYCVVAPSPAPAAEKLAAMRAVFER